MTPLMDSRALAVAGDARRLVVSGLVAVAVINPNFSLRFGAIFLLILAVIQITSNSFGRSDALAVGFLSLTVASLFWTSNTFATNLAVLNMLACCASFVALRLLMRCRRDVLWVSTGLAMGSLVALVQLFISGASFRVEYSSVDARFTVGDLNANYLAYSFVTAAFALVVLWSARTARGGAVRLWLVGLLVLQYVGILINGTRGALVSMVLLVAWFGFWRIRHRVPWKILVVCASVVTIVISAGWIDPLIESSVTRSSRDTGDLNGRLTIWPYARDLIGRRPLFGHGADTLPWIAGNPFQIAAHNAFLDIAVGVGFVGVGIFVALLWSAVIHDTRTLNRGLRGLFVGSFIMVTTPILLSGYWTESPVFWFSLALVSRVSFTSVSDAVANVRDPGVPGRDLAVPERPVRTVHGGDLPRLAKPADAGREMAPGCPVHPDGVAGVVSDQPASAQPDAGSPPLASGPPGARC